MTETEIIIASALCVLSTTLFLETVYWLISSRKNSDENNGQNDGAE